MKTPEIDRVRELFGKHEVVAISKVVLDEIEQVLAELAAHRASSLVDPNCTCHECSDGCTCTRCPPGQERCAETRPMRAAIESELRHLLLDDGPTVESSAMRILRIVSEHLGRGQR